MFGIVEVVRLYAQSATTSLTFGLRQTTLLAQTAVFARIALRAERQSAVVTKVIFKFRTVYAQTAFAAFRFGVFQTTFHTQTAFFAEVDRAGEVGPA